MWMISIYLRDSSTARSNPRNLGGGFYLRLEHVVFERVLVCTVIFAFDSTGQLGIL
jgi:hypothetical protein